MTLGMIVDAADDLSLCVAFISDALKMTVFPVKKEGLQVNVHEMSPGARSKLRCIATSRVVVKQVVIHTIQLFPHFPHSICCRQEKPPGGTRSWHSAAPCARPCVQIRQRSAMCCSNAGSLLCNPDLLPISSIAAWIELSVKRQELCG